MAMRVTTKMMQNTSLRNLNTNKARQEMLTNQLSTGKKISRPSDDPVVAIRSLKLNSTLDKIDQYYENNAKDADKWINLTLSSIQTCGDLLEDMVPLINQCASGENDIQDRLSLMETLQNYKKEYYSIGNSDYAGRTIFTGYRTDLPLAFTNGKREKYTITEQINNTSIEKTTIIKSGDLLSINEGNYSKINETENSISTMEINRIQLSYKDISDNKDNKLQLGYVKNADINTVKEQKKFSNSNNSITSPAEIEYKSDDERLTVKADYGTIKDSTIIEAGQSYTDYVTQETNGVEKKEKVTIRTFTLNNNTNDNFYVTSLNNSENKALEVQSNNKTYKVWLDSDNRLVIKGKDDNKTCYIDDITYAKDYTDEELEELKEKGIEPSYNPVEYYVEFNVDKVYPNATDEAYSSVYDSGDSTENSKKITYIAQTGEVLLGSAIAKELSELSEDTELRITYDKVDWADDDLDPVHYFYTKRYDEETGKVIEYNANKIAKDSAASPVQVIEYDVGNNQSLRVNTTADELYFQEIGLALDEAISLLEEQNRVQEARDNIKSMVESGKYEGEDLKKLENQLAALEKTFTLTKDKAQKRCEALITDMKGYTKQCSIAETNCGARASRLKLINTRLSVQQTNFQELVSENEDADYTDLAIQLKSIEMTYQAALSSISYVMQTSLLDFIR